MPNPVKAIPDGYHSITPYLIFDNAAAAIDFYSKAFGATETVRMPGPGGRIMHAELRFGDSVVMLADENSSAHALSSKHYGGSPVGFLFYVENVDQAFQKAVDAGCTAERPLADQFYGDRTGGVVDPFGYRWYIATHIKDVSEEEMKAAMTHA